ncbi:MAG: hypothetical protein MJK14_02760 [Rivularia sp. ALOHA_DT_140]|nr:hypothetical protein [Rivularia sp. ALOHA_DT_140]
MTEINLFANQINDVKPLSNLTNLTNLDIIQNNINNIEFLSSLTKLEYLSISDNPIENKTCPLQKTSLCSSFMTEAENKK